MGLAKRPAWTPRLALWLTAIAALLMTASAVHASAHHHEHDRHHEHEHEHEHEHDGDHDAECAACIIASLNAAKLAPAEPPFFQPSNNDEAAPARKAGSFFASFISVRNARDPPLFSRPI